MKRKYGFKWIIGTLYKIVFNFVYVLINLFVKINENKAVFVLSRNNELDGNLKYIYKEINNQCENIKIHFVFPENKMNLKLFKELFVISNSKYIFLDDYYLPVYLLKRLKNQQIIQLWHAAGAFKKFGYSTVGMKFGSNEQYLKLIPIHSNYTHVYVSTKKVISYYAEAFNMDKNKIFPLGIPRIDLFNDAELKLKIKADILLENPKLKRYKTKILCAPTYRASGNYKESENKFVDSLINILTEIRNDILILFKAHPYMSPVEIEKIKGYENVLLIEEREINEWMLVSDSFITDYSSAIFEYSLLKRPLAHYIPDLNEYIKNRGLYQDIENISQGAILKSVSELKNWINNRERNEEWNTSRMIKENFDNTENISRKIVSHIMD